MLMNDKVFKDKFKKKNLKVLEHKKTENTKNLWDTMKKVHSIKCLH